MSKECKVARNIVSITFLIMITLLVICSMSSCSTSHQSCAAYASVNKINK